MKMLIAFAIIWSCSGDVRTHEVKSFKNFAECNRWAKQQEMLPLIPSLDAQEIVCYESEIDTKDWMNE